MNKLEIVEALRAQSGMMRSAASQTVKLVFDEMANALYRGYRVEIRGLDSFHVRKYKRYTGGNPKTGQLFKIKTKELPFFKCGKELREKVDRKKGKNIGEERRFSKAQDRAV